MVGLIWCPWGSSGFWFRVVCLMVPLALGLVGFVVFVLIVLGTRHNFACVVFVGLVMVALLLVCLLACLMCFGLLLGVVASWLICR